MKLLDKHVKIQDEVQLTERGFVKTSCINAATVSGPDACDTRHTNPWYKLKCFTAIPTWEKLYIHTWKIAKILSVLIWDHPSIIADMSLTLITASMNSNVNNVEFFMLISTVHVYVMNNNIIHGCLGILNFFLRVLLNVLLIQCAHWWDMYRVQHLQRNSIPPWPCIIPLFLARKVLKYFNPIKRYNILKCEFLLFLVTKWQKIQISKLDIFWVDRDISDFFLLLRSLWKVLFSTTMEAEKRAPGTRLWGLNLKVKMFNGFWEIF